ncbi:MAG: N-acetylmuramoyl-L-alanine amidase [Verrucomicrobiales bacterium]
MDEPPRHSSRLASVGHWFGGWSGRLTFLWLLVGHGPASASPPTPFPWRTVVVDGKEYVRAADVAAFYRFDRHFEEDRSTWFQSPTLAMRWERESPVVVVNDMKFIASTQIVKHEGDVLISRSDLVKWIEPLLRPRHVKEAESFDTVVVDPGHGGLDNGTRGRLGEEKTYTLDVGLRLRDELLRRGFRVVMTRQTDISVPKGVRGELATAVGRCVLVSLHFNQNASPSVHGLETYAMTPVGMASSNDSRPGMEAALGFNGNLLENASVALAAAVHSQILHRCGPNDRGVRRARFAVLKDAARAAILVEGGYLSNAAENARIHMPEHRARLASAIAEGVSHYREAIHQSR